MSRHEDLPRLLHMLDHATEAVAIARGRTRAELDTDRQLNLSLVRLLEIVGEAAARVSTATRERYQDIPWHEIVSLSTRFHKYGYGFLIVTPASPGLSPGREPGSSRD
jgi:uncharacterized protein with HEPN domain